MSFNIEFQVNASEPNKLYKSVETSFALTGTLRNASSIIDPVILVEASAADLAGVNYLHIAQFGRYYFMRDVIALSDKLCEVHAHVDVLYSFADAIAACEGVVQRSTSLWNLYLDDGVFAVYQNPHIFTKSFPSGFDTQNFVLAVAGSPDGGE